MVQYIPSPSGSYPYPNAGKGDLQYQMMGNMGQGLGGIFGALLQAHRANQQRQQQAAMLDQLTKALGGGVPGPETGQGQPPTAGMGGITQKPPSQPQGQGQGQPVMNQTMSQIMPLLIRMGISNPHLVPLLSHMMTGMTPKPPQKETWFLDPKTGEPSMVPKDGFLPLPPQPPGSFAQANRMFVNRSLTQKNRDEAHETHKDAMEMHVKDHMDGVMTQLSGAAGAFEQAYRMSNQVPTITPAQATIARDVASGKGGVLERVMSSKDKAVDYYRKISPLAAQLAPLFKLATPKQKNDLVSILPEPHNTEAEKMQKRRMLRQTIKDIADQEKKRVMSREMMIRHQKDAELDVQLKQDYPEVSTIMNEGDGGGTAGTEFGDQEIHTAQ